MRRLLWILLFLCCFSPADATAYAEEANPTVDWTQDEQLMRDALKEAQPNATEAEVEEVMGHTLLSVNNQWQRAEVHLKRALQLDPKRYMAAYNLGLIFMGSEDGDGYLKQSVEANPDFAPAWYWFTSSITKCNT